MLRPFLNRFDKHTTETPLFVVARISRGRFRRGIDGYGPIQRDSPFRTGEGRSPFEVPSIGAFVLLCIAQTATARGAFWGEALCGRKKTATARGAFWGKALCGALEN